MGGIMMEPSSSGAGMLILLVDDEPLVRLGTAMLLEELDHRIIQAATAAEGLKLLKENAGVDLLITDFRMPDMDGMEMIAQAKAMRPTIKTMLMTGYDADDERFACLDAPKLAKPFGLGALEIALQQVG